MTDSLGVYYSQQGCIRLLFFKCVCIWLCWVLVAAPRIFMSSCGSFVVAHELLVGCAGLVAPWHMGS